MPKNIRLGLLLLVPVALATSCAHERSGLDDLVMRYEAVEGLEIWQYQYGGNEVYYIPIGRIQCCDAFSEMYDLRGELICRSDGGITGRGDGRCRRGMLGERPEEREATEHHEAEPQDNNVSPSFHHFPSRSKQPARRNGYKILNLSPFGAPPTTQL